MAQWQTLFIGPFGALTVALLCVLAERFVPVPVSAHPLTLLRLLAQRLAERVNPPTPRSATQRKIAGALAPLTLLLPTVLIVGTLMALAEFPIAFDALLLFIALQFAPVRTQARRIAKALERDKKSLARESLATISLRQTGQLSAMGIAKATVQSVLLRSWYQQWTVLFCFFIGGGLLALVYRMLFEMAQCWNSKLPDYQYFGLPTRRSVDIIALLPGLLMAGALVLAEHIGPATRALRRSGGSLSNRLLDTAGAGLQLSLGGPAIYAGLKRRYPRVGGRRPPQGSDITRSLASLDKVQLIALSVGLLIASGMLLWG